MITHCYVTMITHSYVTVITHCDEIVIGRDELEAATLLPEVCWSWKSELGLSSSRREESEEAGQPSARLEELDGKRMRRGGSGLILAQ